MIVRHRVPSVFGIYMVDVLCCALGCVILLWQVNYQEAETKTAALNAKTDALNARNDELTHSLARLDIANLERKKLNVALDESHSSFDKLTAEQKKTLSDLAEERARNARTVLLLDDVTKSRNDFEKLALVRLKDYESLKKDNDTLKTTHELALASIDKLNVKLKDDDSKLKDLDKKSTQTAEELAAKLKANAELLVKIAEAEKKAQSLTADLAKSGTQLDEKAAKLAEVERLMKLLGSDKIELLAKLKTAELRVNILEADTKDKQKRVDELAALNLDLDKKIAGFDKGLSAAQELIAKTKDEAASRVKALESRFAGITLTGNRVIFLVDMSGSMELVDENTADPDKWPIVCDTVSKIMTSLPDLKFFQVIAFSDKVRYPLGHDGGWFEYRGKQDAATVAARLKSIKPVGETNMSDAFQEVFGKFRGQGMDTIYMLSDGLPNAGAGLPANSGTLNETQISTILSKHLRDKLKTTWNKKSAEQPRVRINTIGFFFESPDVGAFLWALAREHDGSFVGMSKP